MKNLFILMSMIIILTFTVFFADAMYHSGHITSNQTWNASDNPHYILGTVTVDPWINLTISPGCSLVFLTLYRPWPDTFTYSRIDVKGFINAVGNPGSHIILTSNVLSDGGRGINFIEPVGGDSYIEYCDFDHQKKFSNGGNVGNLFYCGSAIYLNNNSGCQDISISYCTFSYCQAEFGGAVFLRFSPLCGDVSYFESNEFYYNQSVDGGALYLADSVPNICNCLFHDNLASNNGGAVFCDSVSPTFYSCTIAYDTANSGSGIYWTRNLTHKMYNSIVYFNFPDQTNPTLTSSDIYVDYSDIENITTWNNNISSDPEFVNSPPDPYRISWDNGSQCINTGHKDYSCSDYDIRGPGNSRIVNDSIDMGAYEYEYPVPPGYGDPHYKIAQVKSKIDDEYILINSNKYIQLISDFDQSQYISIVLYNVYGQRINNLFTGNISAGKQTKYIETEQCLSGIYFIKLNISNNTAKTLKIIIN